MMNAADDEETVKLVATHSALALSFFVSVSDLLGIFLSQKCKHTKIISILFSYFYA